MFNKIRISVITVMMVMIIVMLGSTNVYARAICKKEHCGNTAVDCGYCSKHGPNYDSNKCVEPGCKNQKYCGSYCASHDKCQVKSACKTANYGGRTICKNEHCGNTAGTSGYCSRHSGTSSSTKTSTSSSYKSSSNTTASCFKTGCNNKRTNGSTYCYSHTCIKSDCHKLRKTNSSYCSTHDASSSKSYSSHKSKTDSYDEGYEAIWLDDDYDEIRYYSDSDYANGVDDAMDEFDW